MLSFTLAKKKKGKIKKTTVCVCFQHGGGVRIRLGPERGGPGADPRPLANERTLVFCAVLSLSSPLIPAAPLTKTRHSETEEGA